MADELDDEAYLEMRKQDPEFQRMVEEEMAKIQAEMSKYAVDAGEEEAYIPPDQGTKQRQKSELLYSPQKSYAPPPPAYDYVPPEQRQAVKKQQMDSYLFGLEGGGPGGGSNELRGGSGSGSGPGGGGGRMGNHAADKPCNPRQEAEDYYSTKRDKQEAYARQLRAQADEEKPDSSENRRRVARPRKPTSPITTQSAMSAIGSYELNRCSPDAKKKGQLQYAAQLAEGRAAVPIPTERGVPLHIARQQRQQAVLDAQFTDSVDASMGAGRGNSGGGGGRGYSVGNRGDSGGGGGPGGAMGGASSGNDERRAKQLAYARQLQADKSTPSVDDRYRETGVGGSSPDSKARRYREAQDAYRSSNNNHTGLNIGDNDGQRRSRGGRVSTRDAVEDEERRMKIEKQRQYAQEIAEGANAPPPRSSGSGRGRRNRGNSSPPSARGGGSGYGDDGSVPFYMQQQGGGPGSGGKSGGNTGRSYGTDTAEERLGKKQAQAEYFKQIQAAASQAPIASSRVSLRQRKLGLDPEGNDYRDVPMPMPHRGGDDGGGVVGGGRDYNQRAQEVAKERLMVKLRQEAARQEEEDQAEAEARYYASKKNAYEAQARDRDAGLGASGGVGYGSAEQMSPSSKFYPGGGGNREGYRLTREDSEQQYQQYGGGGGGGSGASPGGGRYENVPVQRDSHMKSMMSVGYDEPVRGGGGGDGMNSARLSGRRSAHNYETDGAGSRPQDDARAAKRLQQQQYAEEIARGKNMQPIEGDRKATFRQNEENYNRGINLPGNMPGMPQQQGSGRGGGGWRGNSSGGGSSSFALG